MKNLLLVCSSLLSFAVLSDPARIAWPKACASDTLVKGAQIFTDRDYVFNEPPAGLKGRPFLRGSIMNTRFEVVADGELVVLTPMAVPARNGHPCAAAQGVALAKLGFAKDDVPLFQLWGRGEIEQGETWRKQVKAGERYELGKFAIVVGFDPASTVRKPDPASLEMLYNGVTLPRDPRDRTDMTASPRIRCRCRTSTSRRS